LRKFIGYACSKRYVLHATSANVSPALIMNC
jgi:hypothetical protein